jgi:addiction module RelB/DinJ family antitoxin
MSEQSEMFRCRIDPKLIKEATRVAEEIGTTPGEIVRILFKQLVRRRAIPFPLQADGPEDDVTGSARRRSAMWDAMNAGRPAHR